MKKEESNHKKKKKEFFGEKLHLNYTFPLKKKKKKEDLIQNCVLINEQQRQINSKVPALRYT